MTVIDRIQAEVEGHPIVLFMKGTPQFPMCGFSSRAVQALKAAGATSSTPSTCWRIPEIRANLPRYSNWPTFPQLFINGELIGGCDITLELFEKRRARAHGRRGAEGGLSARRLPARTRRRGRARRARGAGHRRLRRARRAAAQRLRARRRDRRAARPQACRKLEPLYDAVAAAGAASRRSIRSISKARRPTTTRELAADASSASSAASTACCTAPPNSRGLTPLAHDATRATSLRALHVNLTAPLVADAGLPAAAARSADDAAVVFVLDDPARVGQRVLGRLWRRQARPARRWSACCTTKLANSPVRVARPAARARCARALRAQGLRRRERPRRVPIRRAYADACVHLLSPAGARACAAQVARDAVGPTPHDHRCPPRCCCS